MRADTSTASSACTMPNLDIVLCSDHNATMTKITIPVDDETYRRARIKAAEQDTSVSALVKRFLLELAAEESDVERLKREERALREQIKTFTAADRLPKENTHERRT